MIINHEWHFSCAFGRGSNQCVRIYHKTQGSVKLIENTVSYLDPVEKTPSDYDSFTTIPDETSNIECSQREQSCHIRITHRSQVQIVHS